MSVTDIWKRLENISETGVSIERLQRNVRTLLLCDAQPWAAIAVRSAIITEYGRHLRTPAEVPFLQDEQIAACAAPLLLDLLKQRGIANTVEDDVTRQVIVLDGLFASVGENAIKQPVYRVNLENTLKFLQLPAQRRGAVPGQEIGHVAQLVQDAGQLEHMAYRRDVQIDPTKTETWEKMAQARLVVSFGSPSVRRTPLLTVSLAATPSTGAALAGRGIKRAFGWQGHDCRASYRFSGCWGGANDQWLLGGQCPRFA